MIIFYHLFIFGDRGIVNGTNNKIRIDAKIYFIQITRISFDLFGIFILLFNKSRVKKNINLYKYLNAII